MPRSLSFCYRAICTNLTDLETAYGHDYDSSHRAQDTLRQLEVGKQKDIHRVSLREFVNGLILENNELSRTIAVEFNLER